MEKFRHCIQQEMMVPVSKLALAVRIFSIISTALYVVFLYDYAFPWYAYTLELFVKAFVLYLFYGILGNFGLFFITTKTAKKTRILATILYVPSVLITPIASGSLLGYIGISIVFLGSIFVYYYFNPWRKDD